MFNQIRILLQHRMILGSLGALFLVSLFLFFIWQSDLFKSQPASILDQPVDIAQEKGLEGQTIAGQEGNMKATIEEGKVDASTELVVSEASLTNFRRTYPLSLWISQLDGWSIQPYEQVSLLEVFQKHKFSFDQEESIQVLSSAIYHCLLQTNFDILERHTGSELPSYLELGFEAKLMQGEKDLVFYNPNPTAYTLHFTLVPEQNELNISLTGEPFDETIQIVKQDEETIQPETIVRLNPELETLLPLIVDPGTYGYRVRISRHYQNHARVVKRQFIAEDYYPPAFRIEERGLNELIKDVKINE